MIQTIADALAERGYDTLTDVQQAVSNPELDGKDLLVSAQTGSGKTVGFGLAIAKTLLGDEEKLGFAAAPLALVVAPTRELAFQVMRELGWLYAKAGARMASCIGGMDARDERRALERGAHIVVGTPGRLRDHIQRGTLDLSSIRAIVLDEADEMLDLGFREDLEFMLDEAPEERRTLLFSATVPPMIAKLAQQYQKDAERVTTLSGKTQHADIEYHAVKVAFHDSENAVINLLRYHEAENAIVFANTRAAVNHLTARLSNRGFRVVCLSGELSQTERTHALQAMRDGRARVCVATDVAARGIDLPNLNLVIHADLPKNQEALLHRSGRTGRAGRKGISALIVTPKLASKADRLLKFSKITAEWITPPTADEILRQDEERLLNDELWSQEMTDDQRAFAARLLETRSPEEIAAACLRLFRAGQSAPEELSDPDARTPRAERKPFGPSKWVALSVGRDDKAEPRWLLPLILRATGISKDALGAIRVQNSETFVELLEEKMPEVLARVPDGGELEDGVMMRVLDAAPDLPRGPAKGATQGNKRFDKPRGEKSWGDKPRGDRPQRDGKPDWKDKPRKPRPDGEAQRSLGGSDKPRGEKAWGDKPRSDKPRGDKPGGGKPWGDKPRGDKPFNKDRSDDRPYKPKGDKPAYKGKSDAPRGDKPYKGKPSGDKPFKGKPSGDKPFGKGKPSGDKPFGKGKPGEKPKPKPKFNKAADTSKRFTAPGKPGKPGPKGKPRPGGMDAPRRKP
ncbi:DEAD/DEAH box helicase [Tropicibacter naphthalenivorans]|uniref:ATP-dependent RNA helicase DbpA n=1 Tax=Tropicibacter naphthalenivorans TaxID=441103 RepID=A0A0N7M0M9_9RHOB|nr:DEAD/DEAH box helicase [Tropicibacter naphthalenivorans]CUH80913.1 ATP-dependent RNA helicase DbpA [Tropicibacter naphthalenivorans]SMC91068.1 ATP-dependent RNA helicase DeaD [Tropicibacter naphthalenivorans]